MARNSKVAASAKGSASDANAGRGSRGGDVSEKAAGRGNGWSTGPAAFSQSVIVNNAISVRSDGSAAERGDAGCRNDNGAH